jgi:hypothetical protein
MVILLITSFSLFVGRALVPWLRDIYQSLSGPGDSEERLSLFIVQLSIQAAAFASRYISIPVSDLQRAILNQAEKAVAGLITMSAGALGNITSLALNAFIAFFVLFFLFRDGRYMLRRGAVILPLKLDQVRRLLKCVKDKLNAIAYATRIELIQTVMHWNHSSPCHCAYGLPQLLRWESALNASPLTALRRRNKPLCEGARPHRGKGDGIGSSESSKQRPMVSETSDIPQRFHKSTN